MSVIPFAKDRRDNFGAELLDLADFWPKHGRLQPWASQMCQMCYDHGIPNLEDSSVVMFIITRHENLGVAPETLCTSQNLCTPETCCTSAL